MPVVIDVVPERITIDGGKPEDAAAVHSLAERLVAGGLRAGLEATLNLIRGGTDGARLSFMGLPTTNIFTGGHNFHSKREWISVQDLAFPVKTLVELAQIWAE